MIYDNPVIGGAPRGFHRQLDRALAEARRWGVLVVRSARPEPSLDEPREHFFATPNRKNSGIHWPTRTIFWPPHHCLADAFRLLHEVSHCLDVDKPDFADEVRSYMLALEYFTARRLHLSGWASWMESFTVDPYDTPWGSISTQQRGVLLRDSFKDAVRRKLLDEGGRPTYDGAAKRLAVAVRAGWGTPAEA